jgi:4-hydroxy-3-methylbut-2-en-1-yl diphosphate reductase
VSNVKVTVDTSSGFCWGVIRTIDIAEQQLDDHRALYSLGDIIHNPMEIERLGEKGLKTISTDDLRHLKDARVLIRAHGEPASTYKIARENNIEIIDATCPVVTKVQERIRKFYDQGYQIVVFGKRDHAEVIGLVGQTNNEAIVIRSMDEIDRIDLTKKTVLFSQTTMDKGTFHKIKDVLKEKIEELIVESMEETAYDFHAKDTICGQVSGRDKKLKQFAADNDVIVFVAGRKSSNGKVLFEICKGANPKTYFIENEKELDFHWLEGAERVGITGATSTPQWLMEKIKLIIDNKHIEIENIQV